MVGEDTEIVNKKPEPSLIQLLACASPHLGNPTTGYCGWTMSLEFGLPAKASIMARAVYFAVKSARHQYYSGFYVTNHLVRLHD